MNPCEKCKGTNIKVNKVYKYFDIYKCQDCTYWTFEKIEVCCRKPFKVIVIDRKDHELYFIREQCYNCGGCINKNKPLSAKKYGDQIRTEYTKYRDDEYYKDVEEEKSLLWESFRGYKYYNSPRYKYYVYLSTDKWKQKRKQVLDRDKNQCQICKKNEATEVHHLTYDRVFDEELEDLLSVCNLCHLKLHELQPLDEELGNLKSTIT